MFVQKILTLISTSIFTILLGLSLVAVPVSAQSRQLVPDVCPIGGCPLVNRDDLGGSVDVVSVVDLIIRLAVLLTYVIGGLAVLSIVIGGFMLIIGKGDTGWSMIKNAIIGLVISILAYTVVFVITQVLQNVNLSDIFRAA